MCGPHDLATSQASIEIAAQHVDVAATVGLHPHDAAKLGAEWDELVALASTPSVVAVGETGFDFYYRHSAADEQEAAFRAQIGLAQRLGLALVIHTRDAWNDTFRVLGDAGVPERTVFHCFTGGPEEARRALALGVSLFSGIVSFKNGRRAPPRCYADRPYVGGNGRRTSRRFRTVGARTNRPGSMWARRWPRRPGASRRDRGCDASKHRNRVPASERPPTDLPRRG